MLKNHYLVEHPWFDCCLTTQKYLKNENFEPDFERIETGMYDPSKDENHIHLHNMWSKHVSFHKRSNEEYQYHQLWPFSLFLEKLNKITTTIYISQSLM